MHIYVILILITLCNTETISKSGCMMVGGVTCWPIVDDRNSCSPSATPTVHVYVPHDFIIRNFYYAKKLNQNSRCAVFVVQIFHRVHKHIQARDTYNVVYSVQWSFLRVSIMRKNYSWVYAQLKFWPNVKLYWIRISYSLLSRTSAK